MILGSSCYEVVKVWSKIVLYVALLETLTLKLPCAADAIKNKLEEEDAIQNTYFLMISNNDTVPSTEALRRMCLLL